MKVQKVEGKRIKPGSAHPWFKANRKIWHELKEGKVVDIPDQEYESIKELYGDSISVVEESKKVNLKKSKEVSDDS